MASTWLRAFNVANERQPTSVARRESQAREARLRLSTRFACWATRRSLLRPAHTADSL